MRGVRGGTQTGERVTDSDVRSVTLGQQPHLETLTITKLVFDTPHLLSPVWFLPCCTCVVH